MLTGKIKLILEVVPLSPLWLKIFSLTLGKSGIKNDEKEVQDGLGIKKSSVKNN